MVNLLGFRAGICKTENAHYISFSISADDPIPFRLQRKIDNIQKFKSQKQSKNWYVQSVEVHKTVPTNAIQIEDHDGVYLVGYSLIPTCTNRSITMPGINELSMAG